MDRPPEELPAGPVTLVRYRGDETGALLRAASESLDHLRPWMPWAAEPPTLEAQSAWVRQSVDQWATGEMFSYWLRGPGGELVGGAGLHRRLGPGAVEIGYWVRADRTRRGYATAAAAALTTAGFSLPGIERVEIHCDEANVASAGVPKRLGYRLDRVEDDAVQAPGETGRSMVWMIDKGTWASGSDDRVRGAAPVGEESTRPTASSGGPTP